MSTQTFHQDDFFRLRKEFDEHMKIADNKIKELDSIREEIMGNQDTGRPSLRQEFESQFVQVKGIGVAILLAILVDVLTRWINPTIVVSAKAEPLKSQTQEQEYKP